MTQANRNQLPALYSQENNDDPTVHVRWFWGSRAAFYATEYDPATRTFFGWITSELGADCDELCYMTLDEMESMRPARGYRIGQIERDMYFSPRPLSEIRNA